VAESGGGTGGGPDGSGALTTGEATGVGAGGSCETPSGRTGLGSAQSKKSATGAVLHPHVSKQTIIAIMRFMGRAI
jgi:hypothetical protein